MEEKYDFVWTHFGLENNIGSRISEEGFQLVKDPLVQVNGIYIRLLDQKNSPATKSGISLW